MGGDGRLDEGNDNNYILFPYVVVVMLL